MRQLQFANFQSKVEDVEKRKLTQVLVSILKLAGELEEEANLLRGRNSEQRLIKSQVASEIRKRLAAI